MRPKYSVPGIVLLRSPMGEASASVLLLTPDFGLVRVRVQGIRKEGAKLASALQTLSECEAMLVRGKEGWRLSGATLSENWFQKLTPSARMRAGRMAALMMRLVKGESTDPALFEVYADFLSALSTLPETDHDIAEVVAALAIVHTLGLDDGSLLPESGLFIVSALSLCAPKRRDLIMRINRGLSASGL